MKLYRITTHVRCCRTYEVDAESPADAQERLWDEEIKPADEEQIAEDVMWVEQFDPESRQWEKVEGQR